MDIKAWLNRGFRLEREVRRLTDERARAYARIFSCAPADGERVQTSRSNVTEEKYAQYLEYDARLNERIDELYAVKSEILEAILTVENNTLREVLIARYINFQRWEEIADSMGYVVRHVLRLHGRALNKLKFDRF